MPHLTLSFKGLTQSTHALDDQPLLVGRDPECQIRIDSLAVAPKHALISPNEDGFFAKVLDSRYAVEINLAGIAEPRQLRHGDALQIGKHTLVFSDAPNDSEAQSATKPAADTGIEERGSRAPMSVGAYLQILSGVELGRILTFKRAVTRLTKLGADHVIVIRNGDTLSLSLLTEETEASIDGFDIEHGIEVPLRDGSVIEVNGIRCRFFCGKEVNLLAHASL